MYSRVIKVEKHAKDLEIRIIITIFANKTAYYLQNKMTRTWRKRMTIAATVWLLTITAIVAQPHYKIIDYAKLNDAVTMVHRIVRDNHGMMWFATDDGLYRFDGYSFVNFKSHSGDGINMPSNRINSMYASSSDGIWCLVRNSCTGNFLPLGS